MQIENIELDDNNVAFNQAAEFIRFTDKNIFLTGKAGTGKTTFLKYIRQLTDKELVVLAPTGVAAINAGGQTIHSFFQIAPSLYLPEDNRLRTRAPENDDDGSTIYDYFRYHKEKVQLIKKLQLLIIDEVSMMRCDLLDVVDRLLRAFRDCEDKPFGGVQILLIGDAFQLPPIANNEEWNILGQFYDSPFFFSSQVIRENPPLYIELKKIYRQKDKQFIDLLNNVRIGETTESDLQLLTSRYKPDYQPENNIQYVTLATHNRIVDDINRTKLSLLPTAEKMFEAKVTGIFPDEIMPTNRLLKLKEGAQVMFVKNQAMPPFVFDPKTNAMIETEQFSYFYYNGKIGRVAQISDEQLIVVCEDGIIVELNRAEWQNIRYSWNRQKHKIEEEIIGTFTQFPIKLAWAITVHKSQGLTFEHVIADVGAAFTHGQVYVALSRCTSFEGLVLKSHIDKTAIKTNPFALHYARNEMSDAQIAQELEKAKEEYKQTEEKNVPQDLFNTAPVAEIKTIKTVHQKISEGKHLTDYRTITAKKLFYNLAERQQISALSELLMPAQFHEVQQRLSAAGMRKGFACLFYGAPGTGKTETVYQLARQTGRDIMPVNISETKSMWYGESEKKIKEVFDNYKSSVKTGKVAPILLFNEADAVIGTRLKDTQHSVDQTANAIQNIILQEMENLEGIMIATTNLTANLDSAFERRFLYKVEFQKPTAETRKEIWQTLIPALSPEEAQELATTYDLSGGEMENIARKCTVETIITGIPVSLTNLHRFCKEEKLADKNQRTRIGFT